MYKRKAFLLGQAFEKTAEILLPDDILCEEDTPDNSEHDYDWFVPYIVNRSFACELYLKSLLSDGNTAVRGHSWTHLFYSLPADKQEAIKNHPYFKGDTEFDAELDEGSRVFTTWRYCFEKDKRRSVEIIFLDHFTEVVGDLAKKDIMHNGIFTTLKN